MTPRKLNVFFAFFAYTGNSTGTSEVSNLRRWFAPLLVRIKTEQKFLDRIGFVVEKTEADTPIYMSRNKMVAEAKEQGCDVLIMVDSDMTPDLYLTGDSNTEPFFDVAFDAIYEHYDRGPLMVGAPYGGTPPHENMFVFTWEKVANLGDEASFKLRQYERSEAAAMVGLQECAALPTGLIAYDLRCFDYISHPYFDYEWTDERKVAKASTEDVVNTRNISIGVQHALGYNPCYCAWSSWAGHNKNWCVGKPQKYSVSDVAQDLVEAVRREEPRGEAILDLSFQNEEVLKGREVFRATNGTHDDPPVKTFGNVTNQEHLDALRDLVRCEYARKGIRCGASVPVKVIEIGSWVGESACAMAYKGRADILCVDTWQGSPGDQTSQWAKQAGSNGDGVYSRFRDNTISRPNIKSWVCESTSAAKRVASGGDHPAKDFVPADIILIDADHTYESCMADAIAWLPHVAESGVLIWHDYKTKSFPGVTRAANEIFGDAILTYAMGPHGAFWLVRIADIDRDEILSRYTENEDDREHANTEASGNTPQ